AKDCALCARKRPQGSRTTGTPCAMVLRLIRALLGVPGLLAAVAPAKRPARSLIPASGDRDHTISPYASAHSSAAPQRPSLPASHVRDDRDTPLRMEAGCADKIMHLRKTERKYFAKTA